MERILSLKDLSYDELTRIRRTILRRYQVTKRDNILGIGFGIAEKGGRLDHSRRDSVLFYVRHKGPREQAEELPSTVTARVRRGCSFVEVFLAGDVVEVGDRVRLSGRRIYFRGRSRQGGTAGCIVAWKRLGTHRLRWGVLTVSHIMPRLRELPEKGTSVRLVGPLARQQGKLLATSFGTGLDAALVAVSREQLVESGIIPADQTTRALKIRPRDVIARDRGATGFTRPVGGPLPITVQSLSPVFSLLEEEIGVLTDVVHVVSRRGAFVGGTSGSLWSIRRQVACLQFGQLGNSSRGLGQPLQHIIDWAIGVVAAHSELDRSEIDFRVVAAI